MSTPISATTSSSKSSVIQWITNHWFETFLTVYGIWVWLPFLAPIFMNIGWITAGKTVYLIYSFFCHQLPERSFFFFGEKTMYSLIEIQAAWQDTINPMILRKFVGSATMGWKVAWSDRMISFYGSVWLFAVVWWPLRRKLKPVSWWAFVLLLMPMIIDGGTHAISDLAGIGRGFRDSNQWLALLTNNAFQATFYAGDALGSFNLWARFITGLLAGLGITWLAMPLLFQSQLLNQKLDTIDHGAVLEQFDTKDSRSSG